MAVKIPGEDEGLANAARTADWPTGLRNRVTFSWWTYPEKTCKKKDLQKNSGNWVVATQIFYMFFSYLGKISNFDEHIFSDGLVQPPTSVSLCLGIPESFWSSGMFGFLLQEYVGGLSFLKHINDLRILCGTLDNLIDN